MKPWDALAPIWNNVIAVYAEDWAMVRRRVEEPVNPQQPSDWYANEWLRPYTLEDPVINPGEMIEVWYIGQDPVEFELGGTGPIPNFVDAAVREMPVHFEPHEESEYIPIFIQLYLDQYEDGNKPVEVAIYVNGECKGASVINEDQVELNAYITNCPTEYLSSLQFQLFFPVKNKAATVDKYAVLNQSTGHYENRNITSNDCKTYMQVVLGGVQEAPIPLVTALKGNYPNPFNPETTIKYELAKSGKVSLDIFNIKGQKVKTLVNERIDAGYHSVKWNGKNDDGKGVATGIYFYKLNANGKTMTHKMLMLK